MQSVENMFKVLMGMIEMYNKRLKLVENEKEARFKLLEKHCELFMKWIKN